MTSTRRDLIKGSLALSLMGVTSTKANVTKRIAFVHSAGWEEGEHRVNPLYLAFANALALQNWHLDGALKTAEFMYRPLRGRYPNGDGGEIKRGLEQLRQADLVVAAGGLVSAKAANGVDATKQTNNFIYIIGAPTASSDINNAKGGVNLNSWNANSNQNQNSLRLAKAVALATAGTMNSQILLLQNANSANQAAEYANWVSLGGSPSWPTISIFPCSRAGISILIAAMPSATRCRWPWQIYQAESKEL